MSLLAQLIEHQVVANQPICNRSTQGASRSHSGLQQRLKSDSGWNGIVPAKHARAHLLALSKNGVTRDAICAATNISTSCLTEIRTGEKENIRATTERLILAVTPDIAPDHSCIPAQATCNQIDQLVEAGYSRHRIAMEFGGSIVDIKRQDKIAVHNARRIQEIHSRLMAQGAKLVSSATSFRLIAELRTEYYKTPQIARELGISAEELANIGTQVTVDFESLVKLVHAHLMD